MLIYCPKCSTGYEIADDLLKERSRKVRCSHCNEIFDVEKLSEKSVENSDALEDISEDNAFEALAAMMRDADVVSENIYVDEKDVDNDVVENEEDKTSENISSIEKTEIKDVVIEKSEVTSENNSVEQNSDNKVVEKSIVESEN